MYVVLQKVALFLFLYLRHRAENGSDGLVKHGLEPFLGEGRALEIFHCSHIFGHRQTLEQESMSK